jgi:hypothetical protein
MPPRLGQQRIERAESKARRTVVVLDDEHPHQRIGKQFQELGATTGDCRTDLAHHLVHLLALGGTLRHESVCLALQLRAILHC